MRERLSLDRGWKFALGHAASEPHDFEFRDSRDTVKAGEGRGAAKPDFDDKKWRDVNLPHDWAIELPFVANGEREHVEHGSRAIGPKYPEHSVGWYRKAFDVPAEDLGRRLTIEFDGAFRDSVVWVNGHRLLRHQSGYTSFRVDFTDVANYGGRNVVTVRCEASSWEGWWYEGAGLYRHVWLVKTHALHVGQWGTFVTSEVAEDFSSAVVIARTMLVNDGEDDAVVSLASTVAPHDSVETRDIKLPAGGSVEVVQRLHIDGPELWSCESPHLYTLASRLSTQERNLDVYATPFGVRTLRWDADQGFFLNGKPVKIKGTCNHTQHAGVGTAVPDALHLHRLKKLKAMGSNAYRCSHYAVSPEVLDMCDQLGLLVMAENRLAGSSPEVLGQLESMIRRDRNHPSIILWSLANEEHTLQWSIVGERVGRSMVRLCHRLDPTRKVTSAMHDRGLNEGFANVVDVHGWNYMAVGDIEAYRARNPTRPIIGSEEGSTVCTRGVYADDAPRGYVRAYDERAPKWGMTAERWWSYVASKPWLAGAFVWTGFDYYGEPIPYKWPCTASHFGLMDLCGFEKDLYHYFKAWWGGEPHLHVMPHWTWPGREGQEVDVRAFTNEPSVELFLNGVSQGKREVPANSHAAWKVIYAPGTLEARTANLTRTVETTDPAAKLVLTADRSTIAADGADVAVIAIEARDAKERFAPTAMNLVRFAIDGPGELIGVGNGDPSSHESDKAPLRRLFNGLAMALVQSTPGAAGTIRLTATVEGFDPAVIKVTSD